MDEESIIAAGILQATKKGETLEKAKQSFINAGYKIEIVESAARKVQSGNIISQKPQVSTKISKKPMISQKKPLAKFHSFEKDKMLPPMAEKVLPKKKKKGALVIIWIILIVLVTLGINGFLVWKYLLN